MTASSAPASPRPAIPGACDAHSHVFGPYDRFPERGGGAYAPPLAPFERHRATMLALGVARALLIQPTSYHRDHRALLDALGRAPESLRGVGVIDADTSEEELAALRAAGVVGLRFVEMPNPSGEGRYPGTTSFAVARERAAELRAHGFHLQLWAPLERCADLAREARDLGLPIVLDHLAGIGPDTDPVGPGLRALLVALDEGNLWIKLTYHRQSRQPRAYGDMQAAVTLLADRRPDRLLYASDWPFVRMEGREPDPRFLLDQAYDWLGETRATQALVANPAELLGF